MHYSISGLSARARLTVGAVALSASMLASATAWAAGTATIVMPDLCDDPAAVFDYEWSKAKHGSSALFYMDATGTVSEITAVGNALDTYDKVYVAAHGGATTVGGVLYDNFVTYLKAAHASTPTEIFLAVCGSGKGPDSLLKKISTKYGDDITKLSGGITDCALTGNGDATLANAEYRVSTAQSDPTLYGKVIVNIETKWAADYPGSLITYNAECKARTAPFDQATTLQFVNKVFAEFSTAPISGIADESTNYLDLIKLNKDGNAMAACGKNPSGTGVVACP